MNDIENTTHSLDKLRPDIAQKLSLMSVRYTTVSGQDYLIEVKNTYAKSVPVNWRKVSRYGQKHKFCYLQAKLFTMLFSPPILSLIASFFLHSKSSAPNKLEDTALLL